MICTVIWIFQYGRWYRLYSRHWIWKRVCTGGISRVEGGSAIAVDEEYAAPPVVCCRSSPSICFNISTVPRTVRSSDSVRLLFGSTWGHWYPRALRRFSFCSWFFFVSVVNVCLTIIQVGFSRKTKGSLSLYVNIPSCTLMFGRIQFHAMQISIHQFSTKAFFSSGATHLFIRDTP